jgi:hypothetical protein
VGHGEKEGDGRRNQRSAAVAPKTGNGHGFEELSSPLTAARKGIAQQPGFSLKEALS